MFDLLTRTQPASRERQSFALEAGEMLERATRIIGVFVVAFFVGSLIFRATVGGF